MYPTGIQTNLTVTARQGTTVTGGLAHTDGTYADLATASAEWQGFWIRAKNIGTAATDTGILMDVAYDDDGAGTNEVTVISNLDMGQGNEGTGTVTRSHGKTAFIPSVIPSGKHVKVRLQGTQASETAEVAIFGALTPQFLEDVGVWTTYGAVTASSRGTLTPAGSGAYGAWTEIGTTSATHNLFTVGYDAGGDTTISALDVLVKIGYGATAPDAGGTEIAAVWTFGQTGAEEILGPFPNAVVYASVGSGVKLWAAIASGETENRGIIIYGATGTAISGATLGFAPVGQGLVRS